MYGTLQMHVIGHNDEGCHSFVTSSSLGHQVMHKKDLHSHTYTYTQKHSHEDVKTHP